MYEKKYKDEVWNKCEVYNVWMETLFPFLGGTAVFGSQLAKDERRQSTRNLWCPIASILTTVDASN